MGTKTVDEVGAESGAEATKDEEKVQVTEAGETAGETVEEPQAEQTSSGSAPQAATGAGQGAGAVVSVALGIVSLTGSWVGTVAAARETLVGQLGTSSQATVAKQIKEVYGDAWHATALWGGLFALVALLVGVAVLARPAFGVPGKPQAVWIKSVAWGGVALGVIGLLLAVLKYTDLLFGLPSAG